jgi:precorrin-6B methylase 2
MIDLAHVLESISSASAELPDAVFRTKENARYFSLNRAMFFDALPHTPSATVLEIGAESGVLTRWLAERHRRVTALENLDAFAAAIAKRCKSLGNVDVHAATAEEFDGRHQFDLAISIGAGRIETAIRCATRALKPSGTLILGIDTTVPVVMKREEIVRKLSSQGFHAIRLFYAFPNVVLPRVVFSEEAVQASKKSFGYWAAFAMRDAGLRINDVDAASASREGKLDAVARACYVMASRDSRAIPAVDWLACAVSSESRHPLLRASTRVVRENDGIVVHKRGNSQSSGVFRFEPTADYPLFEGHVASAALLYAIQGGALGQFLELLKRHALFLCNRFGIPGEGEVMLQGEALDAIPQNVVIEDEAIHCFDLEWRASAPLPLTYVLYRGLTVLLLRVAPELVHESFQLGRYGVPPNPSPLELNKFFIDALGIFSPLQARTLAEFAAFDRRFESFVADGEVAANELEVART